jgi:hypothetical protein
VPSITDEEAATIRERGRYPPMHAEAGRPAHIVHADIGSEPLVYESSHRVACRSVGDLGMGLVDVDEDYPAIARQGTEEDKSLRANDDSSLARRHRRSESSVCDDITSRVGFALEPLPHGGPGDASRPARADQITRAHSLAATVGPLEREEQVIINLLDRGNCRSLLDRTPQALQVGEEDLLSTPLGQTALELIRTIDAREAAPREGQESRPAHA